MTDTIAYESVKSGENTNVVYITQDAGARIKSELENGEHLRLAVKGGGCSGMSYELFSEESEKLQDIDTLIDYKDFKIVIDQKSIIYLKGMELVREDYEQRNRVTESWMTIHDREYLALQKENK